MKTSPDTSPKTRRHFSFVLSSPGGYPKEQPPKRYSRLELWHGVHRWTKPQCYGNFFTAFAMLLLALQSIALITALLLKGDRLAFFMMPTLLLTIFLGAAFFRSARKRLYDIKWTAERVREWEQRQNEAGEPI